jgi:hypothetical protein
LSAKVTLLGSPWLLTRPSVLWGTNTAVGGNIRVAFVLPRIAIARISFRLIARIPQADTELKDVGGQSDESRKQDSPVYSRHRIRIPP